MKGIYKITNLINGNIYIGQSIDIENRFKTHKSRAFNENEREYEKPLYQAFRKYGLENFSFEIIEECEKEELNNKEIYYIKFYNSYNNGYNCSIGGQIIQDNQGEKHPNHKLTEEDVYQIREYYNQHKEKDEVYQLYQDKINFTGFHKVWLNQTWKQVHQDVYTEENKNYYLFKRNSHSGSTNGRAKLTEEDVYQIRLRKKNGETCQSVYKDYSDKVTKGSFSNVWLYQNWKNIVV